MSDEREANVLPSICEKHPDADILHEWNHHEYIWDGMPRGTGYDAEHQYFCSICRQELCSPEEFKKRQGGV